MALHTDPHSDKPLLIFLEAQVIDLVSNTAPMNEKDPAALEFTICTYGVQGVAECSV